MDHELLYITAMSGGGNAVCGRANTTRYQKTDINKKPGVTNPPYTPWGAGREITSLDQG